MRSTFRNPTVLCLFLVVAMVAGKSIIRELLEGSQLESGAVVHRPGRQLEKVPIEQCRVTRHKDLSGKLNRLCDECFQTYRVANFYMECRAQCFDNPIFRGCALALYRPELSEQLTKFINTEVKIHGMRLSAVEKPKAEAEALEVA